EPADIAFAEIIAAWHGIWRSRKLCGRYGRSGKVVAQEQPHNVLHNLALHMSPVFLPSQSGVRVLNDLVAWKVVHISVLGRPFLRDGAEERFGIGVGNHNILWREGRHEWYGRHSRYDSHIVMT